MRINPLTAIEWTSIVTSTIEFIALTVALTMICMKGAKTERTFRLVFIVLSVAVLIGLVQSYTPLFFNFTEENRLKVGVSLVLMQSKSVGLIHIAFNCIIAKTYALIIAFNRRRLQSSVEYV